MNTSSGWNCCWRNYLASFRDLVTIRMKLGLKQNVSVEDEIRTSLDAIETILDGGLHPGLTTLLHQIRRLDRDAMRSTAIMTCKIRSALSRKCRMRCNLRR